MKLDIELSSKKKAKISRSFDKDPGTVEGDDVKRFMDEEEMLDIAEHCFIRMAEMMI